MWGSLIGGAVGVAGALTAPTPHVPSMPWGNDSNAFLMTGKDTVKGLTGNLDWLTQMRDGKKQLMSRQEVARMTADPRARLNALGNTLLRQGQERELAAGRGMRGGMYQAYASKIGEDLLNQQRQTESGVLNQLASMKPQMQMNAASTAGQMLLGQQALQMDAWRARMGGKANERAHGSDLSRALAGASAGSGGFGFG